MAGSLGNWKAEQVYRGSICHGVKEAGEAEEKLKCDAIPPEVLELERPCGSAPPGGKGARL